MLCLFLYFYINTLESNALYSTIAFIAFHVKLQTLKVTDVEMIE